LNARHNAETERLIDRCNEANSGTIVVDGSIGDYIAYSAYESTVNRNNFSTERAIAQDLAENQDEYNHYVINYGRQDLVQYLQEALPFIAEGIFAALFSELLTPLGAERGRLPVRAMPALANSVFWVRPDGMRSCKPSQERR
jgi:hypothetical protein